MLDTQPVVAIRADGSASIGMGHIMRTLAVAVELRDLGACVVFVCSDEESAKVVGARGFETRVLGTEPEQLSACIDVEVLAFEDLGACFIFVDSFFANNLYFERVSHVGPVGSFAFGKRFSLGLDLMVSYLPSDDASWMRNRFAEDATLLLGESYVPLRREFRGITSRSMNRPVGDVLVMSGGSDPLDMSMLVLEAMECDPLWDSVIRHVVAGPACQHKTALRTHAEKSGRTILHEDVSNMAALMCGCDIAITSCGFSCYELAACGVPMVAFATSDDQAKNGVLHNIMVYAGDARSDPRSIASEAVRMAGRLAQNRPARLAMREGATEKGIDGRGAERIARAILEIVERRRL